MRNSALALLVLISQTYFSQSRHKLDSLLSIIKKNSVQDTRQVARSYDKALLMAQQLKAKDLIAEILFNYAGLLKKEKDYKRAYLFMTRYSAIRDSILSDEKNKSMAEMQTRFDTDAKEKEIVLLTKSKDIEELKLDEQKENIEKQRVTIYASGISIILALALAFFGYRSYSEKKKINGILEEKNHAISKQKEILEIKNTQITNSIVYAKSIQDVILPPGEIVKEQLRDSFILFQPKDVVSGDFYWIYKEKDSVYVAAIDCVGHGVPGGFMALHAYNLLERIVKENKNASPNLILDQLNKQVIESLHQNNEHTSVKHGMDLALLKIKRNKIEYSGARNPLLIVSPAKELKEIKADKMFVGGALGNFTNNSLEVENGSMLYVFTDGYADQKGGPENKKYFISVLKELLVSISDKTIDEQKRILQETFSNWKGDNEQMDDVLIMGIRV
jgi:serine phosphatase RsbU (regulator of sigma subunit)